MQTFKPNTENVSEMARAWASNLYDPTEGDRGQEAQRAENVPTNDSEGEPNGQYPTDKPFSLFGTEEKLSYTTIDELYPAMSSTLGIEEKDPIKLLNIAVNELKKKGDLEKIVSEKETYINNFNANLSNMPKWAQLAIEAQLQNKDPFESLQSFITNGIDYSKPFEKHDTNRLLKHYFPDEIDGLDLEEISDDFRDKLVSNAEKAYRMDAKVFEKDQLAKEEEYKKQTKFKQDQAEKVHKSYKKTFSLLGSLPSETVEPIKKILENPSSVFFDDNGFYKEDASKVAYLLAHGENEIKKLRKELSIAREKAIEEGKNMAREELLSRQNGDGKTKVGGNIQIIDQKKIAEQEYINSWTKKPSLFIN